MTVWAKSYRVCLQKPDSCTTKQRCNVFWAAAGKCINALLFYFAGKKIKIFFLKSELLLLTTWTPHSCTATVHCTLLRGARRAALLSWMSQSEGGTILAAAKQSISAAAYVHPQPLPLQLKGKRIECGSTLGFYHPQLPVWASLKTFP